MQKSTQPITDRHAARVLLIDAEDRVLLFRCQEPGEGRAFWITPGGGLEEGETHDQAAARELEEETGLSGVPIGPCVWTRSHTFPWLGKQLRQHERFFLVRVEGHAVSIAGHTDEECEVLTGYRWWAWDEVCRADQEAFAPRRLGELLERLLSDGPPDSPYDVGP